MGADAFNLHIYHVITEVTGTQQIPTADAGAGVEIGTVNPGFWGTTKVVAGSKAYTRGGAVRGRCPSVLHSRFECSEDEPELRYVFSSVRYSRFGGP